MASFIFPCFECGKSFKSGTALICHIKTIHSTVTISKYYCKVGDCIREFDRMKFFEKHVLGHDRKNGPGHCQDSKRLKPDCIPVEAPSNVSLHMESQSESIQEAIDNFSVSEQTEEKISPVSYFYAVSNAVVGVLAKLYKKDNVSRSLIQEIVDCMKELLCSTLLDILQDSAMHSLQGLKCDNVSDIRCFFDIFRGMFDDLDTEHKRFKYFKQQDAYVEPSEYVVGTANVQKNVRGQIVIEPVSLTGAFIPPSKTLKKFLELPNVFEETVSYMESLDKDSDIMENIIQGSLWQEDILPKFGDKLVFPLNMSYDDFETNKDLGSHAVVHKLGAVHIQIASLPPVFQSALENMFLTALFYTSDKYFGLEEVFGPVLEALKELEEEGLEIVLNSGERKRVYFALCLILGDNLGINTILGLVECFRANYFCRICKVTREVTEHLVTERVDLLRTEANYEVDWRRNDTVATGIKERCMWNVLLSFFITVNIYADIMHDVIEGVGDYVMCFVIETFVKTKIFTYDELNELVQCFYYGDQEFGNKPPLITAEHVGEESLKFSATEMLCLIRYFPLMVGHKVEADNPVWKLFLMLRRIIDLLFAPTFARSDIPVLEELITQHHETYMHLSKRPLRPKFHMLLHYGRILRKVGSLKVLWAMRSEAKYKEYRQAAHATSCRKKVPVTLAVKQSLKMCTRFLSKKGLEHKFLFSPFCESVDVEFLDDYENFHHKLPPGEHGATWNIVKWVNVDGTFYKPGMVVVVGTNDFFPQFGVIQIISISKNSEARFLIKEIVTLGFNQHLHSYHVKEDVSWDCWGFVKQQALLTYMPANKRLFFDGETYVMLRYPV